MSDAEISQFISFTGGTAEEAEYYLQAAGNDINTAIGLFMENSEQGGVATSTAAAAATATNTLPDIPAPSSYAQAATTRNYESSNGVRAPDRAVHDVLMDASDLHEMYGGNGITSSTSGGASGGMRINGFDVWNQRIDGDNDDDNGTEGRSRRRGGSNRRQPDPTYEEAFRDFAEERRHLRSTAGSSGGAAGVAIGTSASSINSSSSSNSNSNSSRSARLAELFRPPFDLMFRGSFEAARSAAKAQFKWLMVDLQEPSEFPCQVLNRDIWKNEAVKQIVESSFIFIQITNGSNEGKRYSNYYPVESFPHVAVIDARTGERVHVWKSISDPSEFVMDISSFLDRFSLSPMDERQKKTSSTPANKNGLHGNPIDLTEEEQMELAMALSSADNVNGDKDGDGQVNNTSTSHSPSSKFPFYAEVENLPLADVPEPAAGPTTTRIQIRFPDNSKIVRRFNKNDQIKVLFQWLKFKSPEHTKYPFDLMMVNESLGSQLDKSVQECGLINASVTLNYL